jgi:hypothetical protein
VIWETNVEEKYVFLHLHEGGAYVVPRSVVYRTRDGRYAVNYKILQNSGVFLVGNTTVEKAVADLEDAYGLDDPVLAEKFAEYGLKIKHIEESIHRHYRIELENGKKIYLREGGRWFSIGISIGIDIDMLIIKDEDDYYFVPRSCSKAKGSAKKEQPDQNQ